MKKLKTLAAAAAMVALAGAAQAALLSNPNGTVTDTNTNLIWLQDWNVNGAKNWATQKAWAEGLNFAGSTDWKLPEIGEYAALFAEYGDLTSDTLPFVNVVSYFYLSGTENDAGSSEFVFYTGSGGLNDFWQTTPLFAVAVRPADVAVTVPEPQSLALVLLALGAGLLAKKRRSA